MGIKEELPIIYSCSGCSSAAQMANALAIKIDRLGWAEMSCIAGVGGNVPSLVNKALSGRSIWTIDGCNLTCSQSCLARHGLCPDKRFVLSEMNVPKKLHQDFDPVLLQEVFEKIKNYLTSN